MALEVRLPDVPHSHLCPRAWHCAFSGDLASSLRGQATRETGLGHTAKPFESWRGRLWPSSQVPLSNWIHMGVIPSGGRA